MKVIGFTGDEIQTVYKILATILHLVIFHRRDSSLVQSTHSVRDFIAHKQVNRSQQWRTKKKTGSAYNLIISFQRKHISSRCGHMIRTTAA